ncbi:MAG: glycosyltransferase [Proteobacteria bacterium]|nr:glycosyltransferase [Pseudomonadota bacterium]
MPKFIITICTAKRPKMLSAALDSLAKLSFPDGGALCLLIIENDSHARSADVIETFKKISPFPVAHAVEPKIGIPFARNRALEEALALGADWIAMIDDDELVEADWLVTLYNGSSAFNAEVATGPVKQIADGAPPLWWKPVADSRDVTGELRRDAYTNNVLFSSRLVAKDGLNLRFDVRFMYGAEDLDFFRRAYDRGVRIVSVAEAAVIEVVPAARLVLKRYLERNSMIAASNSFFRVVHHGRIKAFQSRLPGIIRRLFTGLLLIIVGAIVWLFARTLGEKMVVKGASGLAKAIGSFSGLFGRASNYYARVDGA